MRSVRRYGATAAALLAAFALSYLLVAHGMKLPRMLLYLALVAVTARFAGVGPAVVALAGATCATVLSAALEHHLQAAALVERLGVFILCGVAGILASIPRATEQTRSRNGPLR